MQYKWTKEVIEHLKIYMKIHNNLKLKNKCMNCENRNKNYFCNLSESNLKVFESLQFKKLYQKGSWLFVEGESSNGIYVLCRGWVKLSTCSKDGKVIILHIAEPGEILGLSSTVSDSIHITTAEALEECEVNYVRSKDFLRFLEQNTEACLNVVRQLSENYNTACLQLCTLGLSNSVADKLGTLFLGWCKPGYDTNDEIHLKITYTHEELAQMIGTSRESVTRQLKVFRDCNLITQKGSKLFIPDKKKLADFIGVPHKSNTVREVCQV